MPRHLIAVIEYSYEHDGEIVLPAGTRVFGKPSHITPSGFVGFQFDQVETRMGVFRELTRPPWTSNSARSKGASRQETRGEKLPCPLSDRNRNRRCIRGRWSRHNRIQRPDFGKLVAARTASDMSIAGQDEINTLAANQTLVVTVPGNTRFYIVVEKGTSDQQLGSPATRPAENPSFSSGKVPTLEELRELMQLRNELNQVYLQTGSQAAQAQN